MAGMTKSNDVIGITSIDDEKFQFASISAYFSTTVHTLRI